jgi:Domain of unknown function (DUF397)
VGDPEFASIAWQKSTASGPNGDCVEVASTAESVLLRNSQHPSGPMLTFSHREWAAFVIGVRGGEFDFAQPSTTTPDPGDSAV